MGDLERGSYPITDPFWSMIGQPANAGQSNIAVRTNLKGGFLGSLQDAAAALVSGVLTYVAVPVQAGDVISTVTVRTGATAANGPTQSWAALYSGALTTATLLGSQSTSGGAAAIAASTSFKFTLGSKYIVQGLVDAPFGYILVGVSVTATTAVPSLVSGTVPTATQGAWFTNTPLMGATIGSALGATAPASLTLASATALAAPPVVFLS